MSAKGGGSDKGTQDTKETKEKPQSRERRSVSRARRNAELQIEYAEQQHRLAMLRRRIDLATAGVRAYKTGKIIEAVRSFHSYLRILEDWKGCGEGKLMPSNFDPKKDVAELLLISGVYWDLTKLYDRTKGAEKQKEFMHYLEKYILFSKGMQYQQVCLETMRKYIDNEKPIHIEAFKNAYKMMGGGKACFVATSLMDVCEPRTLPRLRRFRDERLECSRAGRSFIRWYYRNGPGLAAASHRAPQGVRIALGRMLDWAAKRLEP